MKESAKRRLDELQARLEYRFSNVDLLRQALVHQSYLNEASEPGLESNERLEFLGDALLGAVVARRLYADFPDAGEGWMTLARSHLVRNETLGIIGRELDLGPCLLMGGGIANDGARDRLSVLSRALEATLAAVWLDGGDRALRSVVNRLLKPHFEALRLDQPLWDSKSQLQQLAQKRDGVQPTYLIVEESGPSHDPSFRAVVEVDGQQLAEGKGRSKQAAEMDAARRALPLIQSGTC